MHSTKQMKRLHEKTRELNPKIAELLFRAICYLLELNNWKDITYPQILETKPLKIEVQGIITGLAEIRS